MPTYPCLLEGQSGEGGIGRPEPDLEFPPAARERSGWRLQASLLGAGLAL